LLNLNLVARSGARGVRRLKKVRALSVIVAISSTLLLASAVRAEGQPLEAAPIEMALRAYFSHPSSKTAKALEKLIPTHDAAAFKSSKEGQIVTDYIEENTESLASLLTHKKSHAVRVALLLQCIYYDHHVRNEIALDLGQLLISNPGLVLKESEAIAISPRILSVSLSCEGICGPDADAEESLAARLTSLKNYCASHGSPYCAPCIEAIETSAREVAQEGKEAS
jgi:hypothetical protein